MELLATGQTVKSKTPNKMSICQQPKLLLLLLLLVLAAAAESKSIAAPQELRQANRVVLELPTINFTRIYNEVPLINFSRLYNRLFNSTKAKPEEDNLKAEEEAVTQGPQLPFASNDIYDPTSGRQLSGQVLNVQIPNQANAQQVFSSIGGYNYGGGGGGVAAGIGFGGGYGYNFPDYAQIYGSSHYNSIPGLQVYQQPGYGYNYANLVTTNAGHGQLYAGLEPYRQWLQQQQQQQLFNAQSALIYDEGLEYEDELESDSDLVTEYASGDDVDDYDDYGDGDELWRQADADSKVKRKKTHNKIKAKSKPAKKKLKQRRSYTN